VVLFPFISLHVERFILPIIMNLISITPCITIYMQIRYSLLARNCIVSDFCMKGNASFVFKYNFNFDHYTVLNITL